MIVQGETFRPTEIEKIVDETIIGFIEKLKKLTPETLEKVKKKTIEDFHEFPDSLGDISERYISSIEEQILNESTEDYQDIAKSISVEYLCNFAKNVFIEKARRVTIELFANEVRDKERDFVENKDAMLDKKVYKLVGLKELTE